MMLSERATLAHSARSRVRGIQNQAELWCWRQDQWYRAWEGALGNSVVVVVNWVKGN